MPKIITTEYLNETKYYQLPKAFFHNPLYTDMRNESKLAYALLRDLLELSIKNNWINEDNEVYVKLSREKMMHYLHIKGTAKYSEIMKELTTKELIVKKRVGLNRIDETYICIPEELSVIYSDEELLELEESDKKNNSEDDKKEVKESEEKDASNVDKSRTFENQTSKGLKNKRPEVRKSNAQRFENQTHTNTKYTNTNSTKTNSTISSSKGDTLALVELFEGCICQLRKTTLPKFETYMENYDHDFIETIIVYGEEVGAKSYRWFETTISSYIEKGITTKEGVVQDIEDYRTKNKKAKNRALKEKDNSKKETPSTPAIDTISDREFEDMTKINETENKIVEDAESLDFIKQDLAPKYSEVKYNTWIAPLELCKKDDEVIINCINAFTRDIIKKQFLGDIMISLAKHEVKGRITLNVI